MHTWYQSRMIWHSKLINNCFNPSAQRLSLWEASFTVKSQKASKKSQLRFQNSNLSQADKRSKYVVQRADILVKSIFLSRDDEFYVALEWHQAMYML